MQVGLFVPTCSGGWLVTTAQKRYEPTFDHLSYLVQRAEHYGMEFALSPVKFKGFGGPSQFWDNAVEAITLSAGLAAVTKKIKLFASIATLTIHPAITARMVATIDSIAKGRFGLNIVSGWAPPEYQSMGMWPGDEHFKSRYDFSTEYVHIMQELWYKGQSNFKGRFFELKNATLGPRPAGHIDLVCAGQSDRGMEFCGDYGDYMFCVGTGVNNPTSHRDITQRLLAISEKKGRKVGAFLIVFVIAEETDEAAMKKWRHYNDNVDRVAIANIFGSASSDKSAAATSSTRALMKEEQADAVKPIPDGAVNLNFATLVGSYANVAKMLDETASVPGTSGVMLIFDDFIEGMENFGRRIQPLMKSRAGVAKEAAVA